MEKGNVTAAESIDKKLSTNLAEKYLEAEKFKSFLRLKIATRLASKTKVHESVDLSLKLYELEKDIVYLLLACSCALFLKNNNDRNASLRSIVSRYPVLAEVPSAFSSLERFCSLRLIQNSIESRQWIALLSSCPIPIFSVEVITQRWDLCVLEHNLFICSRFYSKISVTHLATICGASFETIFGQLCNLISEGELSASIDAISGEVSFMGVVEASQDDNTQRKLSAICHLIQKEEAHYI